MKFKTWKTIEIGTGINTKDDFTKALMYKYRKGTEHWCQYLPADYVIEVSSTKREVDLIAVDSHFELGLTDDTATITNIYKKALDLGLKLCPAEVGPQLRLQYIDQPSFGHYDSQWRTIAMEPIISSRGKLTVFRVGHVNGFYYLDTEEFIPNQKLFNRNWIFLCNE